MLDLGWTEDFSLFERLFAVTTPMMHSEDLEIQNLGIEVTAKWLKEYQEVIYPREPRIYSPAGAFLEKLVHVDKLDVSALLMSMQWWTGGEFAGCRSTGTIDGLREGSPEGTAIFATKQKSHFVTDC